MPTLLVIDDEPNVLYSLNKCLESDALAVLTAQTARQGLALFEERRPDAVVVDVRLPDMSGLDLFDRIRAADPRVPVIVITAFSTTETAIEAIKRGAFEYLLKPVDLHELRKTVAAALESRHPPDAADAPDPAPAPAAPVIVGDCPAMQAVYKSVGRIAGQDVPVLVLGESGTGKELVARAIYQHSRRSAGPFLAINCAAIPEALLESELFGHERGAFTGADRQRLGKFEQAHQGTLFLDEIGDMSPATQAKVLRLLQEQRFERVGGNATVQADVRVIAATNQNLDALVSRGRFRQDLLYRLNGFTIHLPPLRERREDFPALVQHFLTRANRDLNRGVARLSEGCWRLFERHDWPGNVRELQSVIRYAVVQTLGDVAHPEALPEGVRGPGPAPGSHTPPLGTSVAFDLAGFVRDALVAGDPDLYRRVMAEVDQIVLGAVMAHAKGNQVHASEILGISRTTLRAKLQALGLRVEKQVLLEG